MNLEERVKKLLEKDLENIGVRVDSVEYLKEGSNMILRVVIDRDEVIDIDKCVEATNIINPLLDNSNLLDDSYILDVTTKEKGDMYE